MKIRQRPALPAGTTVELSVHHRVALLIAVGVLLNYPRGFRLVWLGLAGGRA